MQSSPGEHSPRPPLAPNPPYVVLALHAPESTFGRAYPGDCPITIRVPPITARVLFAFGFRPIIILDSRSSPPVGRHDARSMAGQNSEIEEALDEISAVLHRNTCSCKDHSPEGRRNIPQDLLC